MSAEEYVEMSDSELMEHYEDSVDFCLVQSDECRCDMEARAEILSRMSQVPALQARIDDLEMSQEAANDW
ncbi:hypothetical protein [Fodinicola feengrottensis]|uniref:Uncharacterized protein n=1 Tax=Fodinicola feengrottensis TaxID=435914 RepID=A0ABP4UEA4_9ACTN|nr:hypothetical protein [Fodinicola feengrottensis]